MFLKRLPVLLLTMLLFGALKADAGDFYSFPYKPDPAITVDANDSDWSTVPNAIELKRVAQVGYGRDCWDGPQDLSGVIHLAWRNGGIAIFATVVDESVLQPYSGRAIWKGDHVNLWLDLTPGKDADRIMLGEGQVHVVLSPGNFNGACGGDRPIEPEIFVYKPAEKQAPGGEIAARRTEDGYVIEAFIPLAGLGLTEGFRMHQDGNFEVAVSDSDALPAKQETLMTYASEAWVYSRQRLVPFVLADGNDASSTA